MKRQVRPFSQRERAYITSFSTPAMLAFPIITVLTHFLSGYNETPYSQFTAAIQAAVDARDDIHISGGSGAA